MKLSDILRKKHESGEFGSKLEGLSEMAIELENTLMIAAESAFNEAASATLEAVALDLMPLPGVIEMWDDSEIKQLLNMMSD